MKCDRLEPFFVDAMPQELEPGYLYVSIRFRTAQHLCACGCGSRVVTPLKPAKYAVTYNGETISLWPSVGNWQKPCKSHYVIEDSRVVWHAAWSDQQIARGRARDQAELRRYFAAQADPIRTPDREHDLAPASLRARIMTWLKARVRLRARTVRRG